MHSAKALFALALICLVAAASAQSSALSSFEDPNLSEGSYVVNGTGIEYDADTISLLVNGEVIQTLSRNAMAPGPAPGPSHGPKPDKPKPMKPDFPMPAGPGAAPGEMPDMHDLLADKPDPLDSIVIGRRLLL